MGYLDDFRQQNPAYKDVPDDKLADGIYNKFYAGKISRDDYNQKLGLTAPAPAPLTGRETQRAQIEQEYEKGDIGKVGRGVLLAGSAAGSIGDVIGKGIAAVTPEPVKKAVGGAVQSLEQTAPVRYTMDEYAKLKQSHPQLAQYLEAAGNIATMLPVGKLAEIGAIKGAEGVGQAAVSAGELASDIKTGLGARDLPQLQATMGKIKANADQAFQRAEAGGEKLSPQASIDIANGLKSIVKRPETKAAQSLYSNYLGAVKDFEDDVKNGHTGLQTLHDHRQVFGNMAYDSTNPQLARAARQAVKTIDDIVTKQKGSEAMYEGIAGWAKYKNFEKIVDIIRKADGDGKKITTGLNKILNKPKTRAGFTPEEVIAMKKAAKEGVLAKVLPNVITLGVGHKFGAGGVSKFLKYGTSPAKAGRVEKLLQEIEARPVRRSPAPEMEMNPRGPMPIGASPMPQSVGAAASPMVGASPMPKQLPNDMQAYLDRAAEIKKELRQAPQFDINKPKSLWSYLGRVPQTLSEFIKTKGGITDVGGDLKSMGLPKSYIAETPMDQREIRGIGGKSGQKHQNGLDAMKEAAHDAGFFREYEDWRDIPNDKFKAAIAEDARKGGKKHYTTDDMEEISKLSDALSKYDAEGITQGMSKEDIATILLRGRQ